MPNLSRDTVARIVVLALYLLSIVAGVIAIDLFGVVPIPGGFMAPAAVYVVGVTLVLRDLLHQVAGRQVALLAIVVGAALSAAISWQLALASGIAFLIAETLDLLIFEKVRDRFESVPLGMVVSNAFSIPVDSAIFLFLAFGSLDFFWGQVIGKGIATVVAIVVLVGLGTACAIVRDRRAEEAERQRRASLTPQQLVVEHMVRNATSRR